MNKTKKQIIDTAFSLFREKGYDKVTVNDICTACEVTKTTFYYHLTAKEEIVSYFYQSVTAALARQQDEVVSRNYWEQFMAVFDTLIDASEGVGPDLLGQLFIINLRDDKGTFDFNENLTRRAVHLIECAQEVGQIRNKSRARPLYRAASHTFEGYDLLWCIRKGSYDRKETLRKAFEDIFDVDPSLRKNTFLSE